jgi:threonine/homoserine/homoserine lactone efflux protein
MITEFKQGLVVGLAVSVPVGPIALLIMRRSLRDGKLAGFVSGLGAATADCISGVVAAFGLSAITSLIEHHTSLLRLVAGVILLAMGVHALRAKTPLDSKRPIHERNLLRAYFGTGGLTIANPATFLGMTFVSAAAGVGSRELSVFNTGIFAAAIFVSSATWWLILSWSAGWMGKRCGPNLLKFLNFIAGSIIIVVGAYQLADVVAEHFWHV